MPIKNRTSKHPGGWRPLVREDPYIEVPVTLPFIISTDRQKADSETRKLIRSHVMRGKNRVKPRRKPRNPLHEHKPQVESLIANSPTWPPSIPRLLCSKFSAIRFADDVDPALIAEVLSFSSIFSKAMFLLDQCIAPQAAGKAQAWFAPMLYDAAYLHAVCFTIQTYLDGHFARSRSAESRRSDWVHYAKTVRILQDRLTLDDDSVRLSDSTIMTVLALSGHAYTTGDYVSAEIHNRGLLKLVSMRGVGTLLQDTKLLIEIIRCDLCMAIDKGSKPLLLTHDNIPWPLMLTSSYTTMPTEEVSSKQCRYEVNSFLNKLHPELVVVWVAMSEFCALANAAAEKRGAKMTEESFLHSMGSIMYRLLHQRFETGSLDEAFRLGLLAFSSPIFLHWNRIELPDPQFTSAYREALAGLDLTEPDVAPREHLWLLMVGALSMAHEPDGIAWIGSRLRTNIERCDVFTWDGMRDLLSSFLWIGLVYDNPGKDVFDSIMSQQHVSWR